MTLVGKTHPCPYCRAASFARVGRDLDTTRSYLWWECVACGRAGQAVELPEVLAEPVWAE